MEFFFHCVGMVVVVVVLVVVVVVAFLLSFSMMNFCVYSMLFTIEEREERGRERDNAYAMKNQ